jgi:RNA polymerase sigma factor (sigma-70 family)
VRAAGQTVSVDTSAEEEAIKHRERLLSFIRNRVPTPEDAEDIVQDVFFRLLDSSDVAEPIENVAAWLYRVARNRIIDWYRKKKEHGYPAQRQDEEVNDTPGLGDILFDPDQDPDLVYARSLIWPALADTLEELPEEQRETFVLHELEGRSFRDISEMTGEPVNTLLSRKRYAVLFLRERLRELYEELNLTSK